MSSSVTLTLEPQPQPEAAPEKPTEPLGPPARKSTYVPAYVAWSVGAVGIVVGTIFGLRTLSRSSTLNSECQPRNNCPQADQSVIDTANTSATISTIAFAAGLLGVGFGTYFTLDPPTSEVKPARNKGSGAVRAWVGPAAAGLAGEF